MVSLRPTRIPQGSHFASCVEAIPNHRFTPVHNSCELGSVR